MRLFVSALFCAVMLVTAVRADDPESNPYDPLADVPAPLREAMKKALRDLGRWAYTVHTVSLDRKGKVSEDTVARYDPSKHYDAQWTLLKKDGRNASEKDAERFRKQRAKAQKNRKSLGELLELKQAELVADAPGAPELLTFVVPVSKEGNNRLPVDKIEVLVRVNAARQELANIELRLRAPVRALVVAKVKQAEAFLEFATVQPEFSAAITTIKADLSASLAFFPVEQHTQQKRSEFKRVTPYDERFNVKLGPLKAIDF